MDITLIESWVGICGREKLEGLSGPPLEALEGLLGWPGPREHIERVKATKDAALQATKGNGGEAALLLLLDLSGVGGISEVGGSSTLRLPAFSKLGKGRWRARDGSLWRRAAIRALKELLGWFPLERYDSITRGLNIFPRSQGESRLVLCDVERQICVLARPELARWVRTFASRIALLLAGFPAPGFDPGEINLPIRGTVEQWCILAIASANIEAQNNL